MDVNLDGKTEEWMVVFDTNNLFLIHPYGPHYQARIINASVEVNKINDFLLFGLQLRSGIISRTLP